MPDAPRKIAARRRALIAGASVALHIGLALMQLSVQPEAPEAPDPPLISVMLVAPQPPAPPEPAPDRKSVV